MKFCNKCGAKVKPVDKDTENNSDTEYTKDIPNSKNNIDKTIILDAPKIKKKKLILILMKILRIISNLFMTLILIIKKNI